MAHTTFVTFKGFFLGAISSVFIKAIFFPF